jgi:site-specific recombinase XerD
MSIPKTLTADQCHELIAQLMSDHSTQKQEVRAFRNAAMAIVMLETGIRVGELCRLRIDDLWYAGQPVENLVVRKEIAKNKKERQIPISVNLVETIFAMEMKLWSPKTAIPSDYAFFSSSPSIALSTRTVERIILDAGMRAFHQEVTPHILRHTFGSRMMRKTNSRVVQALLGHSSLQSTQIYMHPSSEDLKKAIDS